MSDTKRTDALLWDDNHQKKIIVHGEIFGALESLARTLERENADLRRQLAETRSDWFERGRKAALRANNSSGCACVFAEDGETIESQCDAHKALLAEERGRVVEECARVADQYNTEKYPGNQLVFQRDIGKRIAEAIRALADPQQSEQNAGGRADWTATPSNEGVAPAPSAPERDALVNKLRFYVEHYNPAVHSHIMARLSLEETQAIIAALSPAGVVVPRESTGVRDGILWAANWCKQQANALSKLDREPEKKAAFIEAHNALLTAAAKEPKCQD